MSEQEIKTGPVTLREKPRAMWVGHLAYQLPESPTKSEWHEFAAWVERLGGSVLFIGEGVALVRSNYDEGGHYYRTFEGGELVACRHDEFDSIYGHDYVLEADQ